MMIARVNGGILGGRSPILVNRPGQYWLEVGKEESKVREKEGERQVAELTRWSSKHAREMN